MLAIAATTGSTQPTFAEAPRPPSPRAGEVLCRTLQLGVCGTDREILLSGKPWTPPSENQLILGHECLARIESIGADVKDHHPGDLVIPVVRRAIPGYSRRPDLLPFGTFVERGIVREHGFSQPLWLDRPEHLFPVPHDIVDLAVFTEPLTCAEKGANEATTLTRSRLGHSAWTAAAPPRVLVTGMGPIGFAAVVASIARGWPVTMLGRDTPDTFRATLVQRLGGWYLPQSALDQHTPDVEQTGYDLLLECTGSEDVLLHATAAVRSCGVIVWLGSNRVPRPTTQNLQKLIRDGLLRNHLHIGSVNAAPRDFTDALTHISQLARTHRDELAALITARVRPADSLWHYQHRQPQGIKTVLMYDPND